MSELPAAWAAPGAVAPEVTTAIHAAPARPEPVEWAALRPVPLRPFSVLELIDGAIGAVRAVPTALLGWASVLVVALALADFAFTWVFDAAVAAATRVHPLITTDIFGNTIVQYGRTGGASTFNLITVNALLPIVCSGIAATVTAGLIAEPIKRYIDGAASTTRTPTRPTRELVARLALIAIVTNLPRMILLTLYALATLATVNDPQSKAAFAMLFLNLFGFPLAVWLTAEWAVAAPVAALEDKRAFAALGRAHKLVSNGRWRTMWVMELTLGLGAVVVAPLLVCQYYIGSVHGVDDLFNGEPVSGATYWWLVGYVVLVALVQVLTVPFRAAAATMLYVDRRFRREALDIRIAWARIARSSGNGKGRDGDHGAR
jgi:hypothetical protein